MSDVITTCPVFGGPCPRAAVRPAREVEEIVVHCPKCGGELLVGPNGALPGRCPACRCEVKKP